jgi:hypothetical protein
VKTYKCNAEFVDGTIRTWKQESCSVDVLRLLLRHDTRIKNLLNVSYIKPQYGIFLLGEKFATLLGEPFSSERKAEKSRANLYKGLKTEIWQL